MMDDSGNQDIYNPCHGSDEAMLPQYFSNILLLWAD